MSILNDYQQFAGYHWETGSLHNYFAYRGWQAPHTGQPYSEALLMGISGGAVMAYFSFAYQGCDPHVAILTRNTFHPLDTMLERLGVTQEVRQTSKAERATQTLLDVLADGLPAIVWADMYSLPYNALGYDETMWVMMPVLVYGHDDDTVYIADRANVSLQVAADEFLAAWGRVKKTKHRLLTLDMPNADKLASAVQKGIWDCIKLYLEAPPKGSRHNFGLAALKRWADLLVKPKQRLSWAKEFPPGPKLYAGLTSTLSRIALFGQNGLDLDAERGLFANFLDEAAIILNNAALRQAADQFRASGAAWRDLAHALLPDEVALFKETRQLMVHRHQQFLNQGHEALTEIGQIDQRLAQIKAELSADFPLNDHETTALQENLRTHVLTIHDLEQEAVQTLQAVMS